MTDDERRYMVLNLIITGIPSILYHQVENVLKQDVLNLIITGIPSIQNICIYNGGTMEKF